MNARYVRLCLVTQLQYLSFDQYRPFLMQAIFGGITSVQLRQKMAELSKFKHLARQFKQALDRFNIPLIINDYVDIACEIGAAGVHLGQTDCKPQLARDKLGANKIIGLSVEDLSQVETARQLDCVDYIAASAVFKSVSKTDCRTYWGINGLQQVVEMSWGKPVMAIGGITAHNILEVMQSGASGAAVIGALHRRKDTAQAAFELIREIDKAHDARSAPCFRR